MNIFVVVDCTLAYDNNILCTRYAVTNEVRRSLNQGYSLPTKHLVTWNGYTGADHVPILVPKNNSQIQLPLFQQAKQSLPSHQLGPGGFAAEFPLCQRHSVSSCAIASPTALVRNSRGQSLARGHPEKRFGYLDDIARA